MNKVLRLVIILAAFIVAVFCLGLLTIAFGSDRGAIFGLLSMAIIGGIPYLAWWATGGRTKLAKPPKVAPK